MIAREPHTDTAFPSVYPSHTMMILPGYKLYEDILACGMVGPIDFSPGQMDFISPALAQRMLSEEEHESSTIFIHRPPMALDKSCALNNVRQFDLLMTSKLRKSKFCQFFIRTSSNLLTKGLFIIFLCSLVFQVCPNRFFRSSAGVTLEYVSSKSDFGAQINSPFLHRIHEVLAQDSHQQFHQGQGTSRLCIVPQVCDSPRDSCQIECID